MILPGISGAFILLLLGKYAYITGAMKNPLDLGNLLIVFVFLCGAALGLSGFSRVLHFLFSKFHDATIAMLTGFMIGAMRKIWPWKDVLETRMIRGKEYVVAEQNVLPPAWDSDFFLAVGLMLLGFVFVMTLDRLSRKGGSKSA
jgi:putative membrane protein